MARIGRSSLLGRREVEASMSLESSQTHNSAVPFSIGPGPGQTQDKPTAAAVTADPAVRVLLSGSGVLGAGLN